MANSDTQMKRPYPPLSFVNEFRPRIELVPATEVLEWVNSQILSDEGELHNPDHGHLIDADIKIMWASSAFEKQGRTVLGQAEQVAMRAGGWQKARMEQQMYEWFGDVPTFIITLAADYCAQCSDLEFCALIEHELPAPKLEVNLPIQWWFDNNPAVKYGNRENIAKMKQDLICFTPSLHVTIDMLCGDSDTSAAIQLINIMEMAGYDVSAPKAEIVAMRKHIANVEYGMKAISDACIRAKNKKVIFRGKKAEITIN